MVILDVEVYKNYFLLSLKQINSGKVRHFEMYPGKNLNADVIRGALSKHTTISFNGLSFDLPVIAAALDGFDNQALKNLSDSIITGNKNSWQICRDNCINVPATWDHIDLINVAPGQASLKIYGGRLNAPKMQDLPIQPDATITPEQRELLRQYCVNDLETTEILFNALQKALKLRQQMSEQYGLDLRSKSDAQIAETIIKSELTKKTGKTYSKPKMKKKHLRYFDPGICKFENKQIQEVFERLKSQNFELAKNGSVAMPQWLKDSRIEINGKYYQMGIGGLHSCEKSRTIQAAPDEYLIELDVSSYYPAIILQQQLAPENLGHAFLKIYESIVKRRLHAKRIGDKSTADSLKIAVNGSFGKLGSKYSALYAPELLIQTTITGQLALLMLIERMEDAGISVVSANTDGVVLHFKHSQNDIVENLAWEWMLDTTYTLERTDYALVASRDVNNYLAIKSNGNMKGKGCFASPGMMKNPDRPIVYTAVAEYLAHGTPIEKTITNCKDITQFITVRTVKGGALWRGELLGKAIRYYSSTMSNFMEHIEYASNGNKVPNSQGCAPLMDLPGTFPEDVEYETYIADAYKLLKGVGYNA